NRESYGGVEKHTEVVGVVRVLPEVVGIDQQEFSDGLLKAGIELVAKTGLNCDSIRSKHVLGQASHAGGAGEEQILIKGRFHGPGVGDAKNCPGALDVVGDADAWLGLGFRHEAII